MRHIHYLTDPFTRHLPMTVAVMALTMPLTAINFFALGQYVYGVYALASNLFADYLLMVLYSVAYGWRPSRLMVGALVWAVAVLWCVAENVCYAILGDNFDSIFVSSLRGTNVGEAGEFIDAYFSLWPVTCAVVNLAVAFGLYVLLRRADVGARLASSRPYRVVMLGVALLSGLMLAHNTAAWGDNVFFKTSYLLKPQHLPEFTPVDVVVDPDVDCPAKIVVILGESFSSDHSSLYGYERDTNPRMAAIPDSNLIVAPDVTSCGLNTIEAFINLLTTSGRHPDDYGGYETRTCDIARNWHRAYNLPSILRCAGVSTRWITTQATDLLIDNNILALARLNDTIAIIGEIYSHGQPRYDEEVLARLRDMDPTDHYDIDFIHLNGSHTWFRNRYPADRAVFDPSMYTDRPEHQRETLAYYDNSIAYNDSVVSEIYNFYKDRDALLFYFSDHGLDIYQYRDDYMYYANREVQVSRQAGMRIPFMVFVNDTVRARHPGLVDRLGRLAAGGFNTRDMMYTIMHLRGIRFRDNDDVDTYTLF